MTVTVRPMTEPEFDAMTAATITSYAAENVTSGRWSAEAAEERSRAELAQLLPAGFTSPGAVFLVAERVDDDGAATFLGHVWVEVVDPRGVRPGAWVYDIEVVEAERGKGYSRVLLAAAERAAAEAGAPSIGLNVFGHNSVAVRLYETSGYAVATQQMLKVL